MTLMEDAFKQAELKRLKNMTREQYVEKTLDIFADEFQASIFDFVPLGFMWSAQEAGLTPRQAAIDAKSAPRGWRTANA